MTGMFDRTFAVCEHPRGVGAPVYVPIGEQDAWLRGLPEDVEVSWFTSNAEAEAYAEERAMAHFQDEEGRKTELVSKGLNGFFCRGQYATAADPVHRRSGRDADTTRAHLADRREFYQVTWRVRFLVAYRRHNAAHRCA